MSRPLAEREWQAEVVALARELGWLVHHSTDARRDVGAGFPDLVLVHPARRRVLYAELKTEHGVCTAEQGRWLAALENAGQPTFIWRPSDREYVLVVLAGQYDTAKP